MKISTKPFRVRGGEKLKLRKRETIISPLCESKEAYGVELDNRTEEIAELQELLYAHNRYSVLLIFQAMDAAGKDSTIKHVLSGVNPQGCEVYSFKQPCAEELDHDFLWRTAKCLPERGRIGVFNRSYYEEVLVVRVHPEYLQAQNLPDDGKPLKQLWKDRYRSIAEHEEHLYRNGTRIIKFYLHVSREEQRKRFLKRLEDPQKNWKFNASDLKEGALWDDYMDAYEHALSATSTEHSPWYIIPADRKDDTRLIVSEIVLDTLKSLKMSYPTLSATQRQELQQARRALKG
ncbi:MAG: ADP-polyphosphate phosphotransferase [Bdellovibrionota bacterium]